MKITFDNSRTASIYEAILQGERLAPAEARFLWEHASDDELKACAQQVRNRFHAPDKATYLIMRIINYTNICVAKCDYCAFYRLPNAKDTYLLPHDAIFAKIDEILNLGGDLVGFNGGFNPNLKIDYYADLFSAIRKRYEDKIEFYAMTVVELMYVARISEISIEKALRILKDAGVRWITGGGAEILADSFRLRHSPQKYMVGEYLAAQRSILEAGLNSTATMVIGFDESFEERLAHLIAVRDFQDQVLKDLGKGLFSFLCWTYKPYETELGGSEIQPREYLRHLALSRIFLDNISHLRSSVLTQNANALKGLSFGANDFDVCLEDEVTESAGAVIDKDIERVLALAHQEGFQTVFRPVSARGRVCLPG